MPGENIFLPRHGVSKTVFFEASEKESQRRLNAKSYFFRTAQNDFSARFRIGQKYAQPESALKPILDLFFFPRGVVFSQSPAKSLFDSAAKRTSHSKR